MVRVIKVNLNKDTWESLEKYRLNKDVEHTSWRIHISNSGK